MGKKEQYAEPYRDKGYDFTPLVNSVDGALEKDAEMFLKKVAHLVSLKWDRTYGQVCAYMKARIHASSAPQSSQQVPAGHKGRAEKSEC
uniref:Uncharacterized protein n=1 Tax=Chromera velia CCMP2878 TaxID=1169474 RepID=A0A0G4HKA2_9ALVE|eukprot:Cvel_1117.t1-p1 / transcript=Cvel_1117.t1 / gene=Cvel_1117 / organism=Chromera_velia_CCMP2878 / gene_product=hypothetical protein / transcript_product=hypothetical protein / location=Cvel_scaffold36:152928-153191(+) / protein_length=88 / sequence_SO=supercontig / SO=protein_coding / is_pseudo=false